MTALHIIGAGGHGKVAADTARAAGWDEIAFLDPTWPDRQKNGGWAIVGRPERTKGVALFCAVGNNATRAKLFATLSLDDAPILVHPFSACAPSAILGGGTLIIAGTVVNPDVVIGRGVILNTGCSVDHDCVLEDFVHLSPGARLAGNVHVGARSWIGIGAVVREGVVIGKDAIVGAGAVVLENIPDKARVAGAPAHPL